MLRCIFIILFLLPLISSAQQSEFLWGEGLGGPYAFNNWGQNIISDASGNIFVTGSFYNTVDFDPGPGTANLSANNLGGYVAMYDSSGNYNWAFRLGNNVYNLLFDDSMNIYVSGTFWGKFDFDVSSDTFFLTSDTDEANIFVAKFNYSMDFVWAQKISGSFGQLTNRKVFSLDKAGNVFIGGQFADTAYFGNSADSNYLVAKGWINAFFAKYDNNGNFLWAKGIEGKDSSVSLIPGIITDNSGNCYITGMIQPGIKNDFDPGTDTAFLITTGGNYDDGFLAKYDANGNYIWAFAIDALEQLKSYTIDIDNQNNIYIAGSTVGDADFDPGPGTAYINPVANHYTPFFAKYDSAGNYLFAKKITSYGTDEIFNLIIDPSGKIAVAGYFTDSTADFDPGPAIVNFKFTFNNLNNYDAFWAVYDSVGNYILGQSLCGNNRVIAYGISLKENDLLISGDFKDTIYFDYSMSDFRISKGLVANPRNTFFARYRLDFINNSIELNDNHDAINIYPNPFTGGFTVSSLNHPVKITVHNIYGQMLYQSEITHAQCSFDFSSFPAGIYFLSAKVNGKAQTFRLVKL